MYGDKVKVENSNHASTLMFLSCSLLDSGICYQVN